jgi:hypothetical protein
MTTAGALGCIKDSQDIVAVPQKFRISKLDEYKPLLNRNNAFEKVEEEAAKGFAKEVNMNLYNSRKEESLFC